MEFALLGVGVTSSLQREHVVVEEEEEKPQEEEKANNNNNNHAGKQRTRWERIMANRDGLSGYIWYARRAEAERERREVFLRR